MRAIPQSVIASLTARGLLPPEAPSERLTATVASWGEVDAEAAAGCLVGGAIGDALGRPNEGALVSGRASGAWSPPELRDFVAWRGWAGGPKGTYTDDTQLTVEVARVLLERGLLDPEHLGRRLIEWLPVGRGKGRATVTAVQALAAGTPWHDAGTPSAGNGAAMRVAPIGIARARQPERLRQEAALCAVVTHASPMAVSSSIVMAGTVAWCLHHTPARFDVEDLLAWVRALLEDFDDPGAPDRQPGGSARPVRLIPRIEEWLEETSQPVGDVLGRRYSGAYVLESLPAALWCFVHAHDDPERAIVTAANGTRDSDTVASMTGQLVGALHGLEALPARWRGDLEDAELIAGLGRRLAVMV